MNQGEWEEEKPSTLTKADVVDALFEQAGLTKAHAKSMVEAFFLHIGQALAAGNTVKLHGIGQFQVRDKPARPGRNPHTKEPVTIAARRVVLFQPSTTFRQKIRKKQTDAE